MAQETQKVCNFLYRRDEVRSDEIRNFFLYLNGHWATVLWTETISLQSRSMKFSWKIVQSTGCIKLKKGLSSCPLMNMDQPVIHKWNWNAKISWYIIFLFILFKIELKMLVSYLHWNLHLCNWWLDARSNETWKILCKWLEINATSPQLKSWNYKSKIHKEYRL